MTAITKLLAGSAAIAAIASAAPAAAQYYPGYGYGSPYGGNVVGQVLNSVMGGGYGYGNNSQMLVNQCSAAVQARLGGGGYGYGYGNGYGYGGGRVLGVTRVEPRESGRGMRVWGVASSGAYGGGPDLTWSCRTDYRGYVVDVDLKRGSYGYGYGNNVPYNYDYSQYGYRRY
jgi:hypothetical protein